MVHKNIVIQGWVQGVGFRYAARKMAFQYGINGFVRNLPDGSVYIEAEGSEASGGRIHHVVPYGSCQGTDPVQCPWKTAPCDISGILILPFNDNGSALMPSGNSLRNSSALQASI